MSQELFTDDVQEQKLSLALLALHLPDTPDMREHLSVWWSAAGIYIERDALRGDIWKRTGWPENLRNARGKLARLLVCLDQPDYAGVLQDDALDLINYMSFFVRNVWHNRRDWQL